MPPVFLRDPSGAQREPQKQLKAQTVTLTDHRNLISNISTVGRNNQAVNRRNFSPSENESGRPVFPTGRPIPLSSPAPLAIGQPGVCVRCTKPGHGKFLGPPERGLAKIQRPPGRPGFCSQSFDKVRGVLDRLDKLSHGIGPRKALVEARIDKALTAGVVQLLADGDHPDPPQRLVGLDVAAHR